MLQKRNSKILPSYTTVLCLSMISFCCEKHQMLVVGHKPWRDFKCWQQSMCVAFEHLSKFWYLLHAAATSNKRISERSRRGYRHCKSIRKSEHLGRLRNQIIQFILAHVVFHNCLEGLCWELTTALIDIYHIPNIAPIDKYGAERGGGVTRVSD